LARFLPVGFDLWVTRIGDLEAGVSVGVAVQAALGFTAKARLISLLEAATKAGMLLLIATR
jgi:hypothetical protein